jgi:hypothetical protein
MVCWWFSFQKKQGGILVQSTTETAANSRAALWAGRIITGLVILFLLFDAVIKLIKLPAALEGTVRLGYPASVLVPLGVVLLTSVVLYAIPHTSVLGSILLTGYLGGATATQVRVQDPWFVFPVLVGALAWTGLYLRDDQLRALIPLRKTESRALIGS